MEQVKRFIVEVRSSYAVEADSPDAALRAVLPIVAGAESVAFSISEVRHAAPPGAEINTEPYAHLTKSTYKVNEVAEILGVSRNQVYEKVPCIRVGSRRLYPRATIIEILQHGLKSEEPPIRPEPRRFIESRKAARIVPTEQAPSGSTDKKNASDSKILTMKEAAAILGLSYGKTKELFDSRKIYSVESYGTRMILRSAVEHFLNGGTAREFVEDLIKYAQEHKRSDDDPKTLEKWAREIRKAWRD